MTARIMGSEAHKRAKEAILPISVAAAKGRENNNTFLFSKNPSLSMRFRHITEESLDKTVKKIEKTDEKSVAKAQLLKSKEWQDHVLEHHSFGAKAHLVEVKTTEDSDLFKKVEEKKDEKEEPKQQHTINHPGAVSPPRTGYLGSGTQAQRGPDDAYFGAESARLKAISGQCSCGMEVSTGWQPEPTPEQKLKSSYATGPERDLTSTRDQEHSLYAANPSGQQPWGGQQERQIYTTHQPPGFGGQNDQRKRRTTAL